MVDTKDLKSFGR